ncbi:MAG: hypothetical protein K1X50_01795 [Candidatus Promineofilum sp.]|nr:hypothetical protein [Promineifilum sp.]
MTIYAVQTFNVSKNARRYELSAEIPAGEDRTALLFVHAIRAAANADEFELSAGEGWRSVGKGAATTTNRRYVSAAFAWPEPAEGTMRIVVEASKALAGIGAFLYLAERARPGEAVAAVGAAAELVAVGPFVGPVVYGVQARAGGRIEAGSGAIVARLETQEADATTRVVAALGEAGTGEMVTARATAGQLVVLLAVPLVEAGEPPPPAPPPRLHELSVVVRDIPVGGSYEVRHVRPGDIVVAAGGGIDWEATPYTSHLLVNGAGDE